jgi:hypothetical protein
MDISYQFKQVGILLAEDGFVPILKKVTMPLYLRLYRMAWPVSKRRITVAIGTCRSLERHENDWESTPKHSIMFFV